MSKHVKSITTQEYKNLRENSSSLKGKMMRQTPNNSTILNRDYNIKFFFSFHSLPSFSRCIPYNFLLLSIFFSSLLLALTHAVLQDCTVLSLTRWDFSSSCSLAEWCTLYFFFIFFFSSFNCLTSLTSHLHLCGLTFVHHFINVAGLLDIIIEEKTNPILLFRTSYPSKPNSSLHLSNKLIYWAKTNCGLEHGAMHPTISPSSPLWRRSSIKLFR